jgi:ParB family chromosome partitioning protein
MIATKTKPRRPAPVGVYTPPTPTPDPAASDGQAVAEQEIPLSAIADSPYQLRKSHDEDLEGLRDTLLTHGLLQAVVVRPIGAPGKPGRGRYELLAGHRRCAAARLAGWKEIRARIQEADDDTAREIVVIENLLRRDLTAVEEAQGFQAMLAGGHYATQEAVAARLGCSQAHVANRLRYLRLPAIWQEAIISGEIPHTYARAVLPYCDDPRAAAAIAPVRKKLAPSKAEAKRIAAGEEVAPPSYDDLVQELSCAFRKSGIDIGWHQEYDKQTGRWIQLPAKLTEEMRRKLDIITVHAEGEDGERKQEIARNRAAWLEIAREHAQREEERTASRGKKKTAKDKPAAGMTAAERKQAAAEEARNKKKRLEQQGRRRGEIAADWKRLLIGEALADPRRTGREVLMVCLYYQTQDWKMDRFDAGHRLDEVAKEVTGSRDGLLELLAAGGCEEAKLWDIARRYAGRAFVDPEGNPMSMIVDDFDLDPLVAWLKIDLAAAWEQSQMGILSGAWWEAHDKEELLRIGGGACCDSHMKKGEMVNVLAMSRSIPFPAELRPSKGKRKPR